MSFERKIIKNSRKNKKKQFEKRRLEEKEKLKHKLTKTISKKKF